MVIFAKTQLPSLRRRHFNEAYTHIAEKIDVIYKDLTRSVACPAGGTAYLTAENGEVCVALFIVNIVETAVVITHTSSPNRNHTWKVSLITQRRRGRFSEKWSRCRVAKRV